MSNHVVKIQTPVDRAVIAALRAGDRIELSGDIFVFRDQVHRILCGLIEKDQPLPFSLENAVVYYCGPTPSRKGMPVGSAGPTTASRMDVFMEPLLEKGLAVTIGKGNRSHEVSRLLQRHCSVYLVAVGGTGAFLAKTVKSSRIIAFPGLGTEAARVFTVEGMPLIVGLDSSGGSAFV